MSERMSTFRTRVETQLAQIIGGVNAAHKGVQIVYKRVVWAERALMALGVVYALDIVGRVVGWW